jgi:hypothetical protein
MFDINIVYEALKRSVEQDSSRKRFRNADLEEASLISLLIHDIFGGEILKTHKKKGWHFYNRIEGKRIDFTKSDLSKSSADIQFEDIPSTPDEINNYIEKADYSTFFMKFIRAFEEAIGLDKYRPVLTT